jgi:hypothetical protein
LPTRRQRKCEEALSGSLAARVDNWFGQRR